MATKKKSKKSTRKRTKRIYNPLTRKYYVAEIQSDGKYKIIGLWHSSKKKKKEKKKSIWDLFG